MKSGLVSSVIIFLAITLPVMIAVAVVAVSKWKDKQDQRRTPLTTRLYNSPGEHARLMQETITEDISSRLLVLMILGPFTLIVIGLNKLDLTRIQLNMLDLVIIFGVLIAALWYGFDLARMVRRRRKYVQGLQAERAVAQELSILASRGCDIFHSVPIGNADIDHIVIGPATVYTVETKSRYKPQGRGRKQAEVKFNGTRLDFPGWIETKPLDQAKGQAKFLADYLYRKTGEHVSVLPVVALPGWYVVNSQKKSTGVQVINSKAAGFMGELQGTAFTAPHRRRTITAIEELYSTGGKL